MLSPGQAEPPHEPPWKRARSHPIPVGHLTRHDSVAIAFGVLHKTLAAGGQIALHARWTEPQPVEVDDIEIRPIARLQHALIEEPHGPGRIAAVPLHHRFHGKLSTTAPISAQWVSI